MTFDPVDFARQNIKYFVGKEDPNPEEYSRINYIMRGDGLWEIRKNKIGTFTVHKFKGNISGFSNEHSLAEGFDLALPKIPKTLLDQILSFFRKLTEDHDFEAYVQIFWNPKTEEYFLFCPDQKVSKGRVKYEPSDLIAENVLVCEIHSHNSMEAYFSPIDDDDEKKRGDRFFGVVGRLNSVMPTLKLSYIVGGGKRVYVRLEDLFEYEPFPAEWLSKITYVDRKKNAELHQDSNQRYKDHQLLAEKYFQSQQDEDLDEEEEDLGSLFSNRYMNDDEEYEDEEYEDEESEDVYDNMDVVNIDDFADWSDGNEQMQEALNNMLANQGSIGREE